MPSISQRRATGVHNGGVDGEVHALGWLTSGVWDGGARHSGDGELAGLVAWISTRRRVDVLSAAVHAYPTFTEGPSRADEVLRARYVNPRARRVTRPCWLC